MFDLDEMMKRAQAASDAASRQLHESMEKSRKIAEQMQSDVEKEESANQQRQVEILGQMFTPETMAQMADNQDQIQAEVARQVADCAALGVEGMMGQLFGEDMGVIAAALETLSMEEDEDGEAMEDEEREFDLALEQELYHILEEKLSGLDALPEPEPVSYDRDDARWSRFGILLSGIISTLNGHELDGMDVEEHIPVMEQRIAVSYTHLRAHET